MKKDIQPLLEEVLHQSGQPLSAEEVLNRIEDKSIILAPDYIDERSTPVAAIQAQLEEMASIPGSRVNKLHSGNKVKFQWVYQSTT